MEKKHKLDTINCSAYSVPGSIQDTTLNSTPMPQAASTAMKRGLGHSLLSIEMENLMNGSVDIDRDIRSRVARYDAEFQTKGRDKRTKQSSALENASKSLSEMQEKAAIELEKIRLSREKKNMSSKTPAFCGTEKLNSWATKTDLQYDHDEALTKFLEGGNKHEPPEKEFEFVVPQKPIKKSGKELLSNMNKRVETMTSKLMSEGLFDRPRTGTPLKPRLSEVPRRSSKYDHEPPEKLSNSLTEACAYQGDIFGKNDRISMYSSADSSLGILSPDTLEGVRDCPLTELGEKDKLDLSQRLAEELKLDTSNFKGLHISDLASSHLASKGGRSSDENKENLQDSVRKSSDYFTSYSSSDSSSRLTAKEVSRLTLNLTNDISTGDMHVPEKELSLQASKTNLLKERNSLNGAQQLSSNNPFGDCSKISVSSEDFQCGTEAEARLCQDEDAWLIDNKRSLSGIFAGGDVSFSTQGQKLSISSFLRSGSGPLGSLEKTPEGERPSFGLPVHSPERKHKPRPILPPPEDKLTFCMEEPNKTKDTSEVAPWNLESLLQQYSEVHDSTQEADISVPSLSCIGALLSEMENKNIAPRQILDKLMATKNTQNQRTNQQRDSSIISLDDSALSNCSEREKMKNIPAVIGKGNFCRGYESDKSTRYSSSFNSYMSMNDEIEPVSYSSTQRAKNSKKCAGSQSIKDDISGRNVSAQRKQMNNGKEPSVIVIDDSVSQSVCDVTDFEGEEEHVCVLTPESMDFDIFNKFDTPQHYSVSKSCYVNGKRQDNAALIHLPVTNLMLMPGQEQVVFVTVAALVEGTIKIKLEVTRTDMVSKYTETGDVYGKIVAEYPKILLVGPPSVNMMPVIDATDADFRNEYRAVIELKNNGRSKVPLKLSVPPVADATYSEMFYFNSEKSQSVTVCLEPGQTIKHAVFCQTPPIFELSQPSASIPVATRVDVQLDTSVQVQLPPITSVSCHARLSPNFFSAPDSLLVSSDTGTNCRLYNSSSRLANLRASTTADYSVYPSSCTIQPYSDVTLGINFTRGNNRQGTLTLYAVEQETKFNVNLYGSSVSVSQPGSSYVTPISSRATSPISPCSSVGSLGPDGNLMLTCTHHELVWGGCSLHQRNIKTCYLKNKNTGHREKLLLKISDQNNCFKLLGDKNALESSAKLSLQPMENRQISVVMIPGTVGPQRGLLTISRIHSPGDKKVLPLYGFGGKAKVNIEGVLQDDKLQMWLYLDSDTLSTTFSLTNNGDFNAFIKISEGVSATTVGGGLSIVPPELILSPGHSAPITISLSVTPERLEYLLAQQSQVIRLTQLTVTHGDESTRQRLNKLTRLNNQLAAKLSWLSQMPSIVIPNLDILTDPSSCAETLYLDDVHEWSIGVLVKRSDLEALHLDTSVEFQDLANTVIH